MEKNIKIPVKGMHCRSCEIIIEDQFKELPNVQRVDVNYKKGVAVVYYKGELQHHVIINSLSKAGYEFGKDASKPFFNLNIDNLSEVIKGIGILLVLYILLRSFGLTDLNLNPDTSGASLGMPFVVGLVAGISTCMALIGGLILGLSTKFSQQNPQATRAQKFRPHLYFVGGRILGYAIFGGLLGLLGSVFELSSGLNAALTMLVGGLMLFIGLQLTNLFPRLTAFSFSLPASVSKLLGINKRQNEYSHKHSAILGGLTFFLPCGFTQAMQVFAVSRGSFVDGAIIMGLFAIGTAPGLLSVGGLTSSVKGSFKNLFFKTAGIAIVLLSLFNISNGYTLLSTSLAFAGPNDKSVNYNDPNVVMENGVQIVRMEENNRGYSPNSFAIKKGVPVKWVIDAQAPYSCAASLVLPKLSIKKNLKAGENIIEFTPKEAGKLPFSCSMGMYTGVFIVYDENTADADLTKEVKTAVAKPSAQGGCGGSGGCGCGGGAKANPTTESSPVAAVVEDQLQKIKTTYTQNQDIQPSNFTLEKGKPARFEIFAKEDGGGCMSYIQVEDLYEDPQLLEAGKTIVMDFTPKEAGEYFITCGMGMVRGTITVK